MLIFQSDYKGIDDDEWFKYYDILYRGWQDNKTYVCDIKIERHQPDLNHKLRKWTCRFQSSEDYVDISQSTNQQMTDEITSSLWKPHL